MIRTQTRHAPALPVALPAMPLASLVELPALWRRRALTRRDLARMDRHLLSDIGLTEQQALAEVSKPFWRE
ncbi:DUF1127 domain-containing protein [Skermanella sp. TT6]|uniref:DUF1127 domain-containing protein n=1 Tax=Skermanella cutis TaxID=2775420 RepID=A0ABX7BCR7_9PROT|nr:DUF1127 domain-containing protein [Skermanella sp. TT6]QQP90227.1 DUF1127 domain-containing protein [Skermanella sp. TT6]